jgi:hypothetical protein
MRHPPEILSVTYVAQVHSTQKRFVVPKSVRKLLKINTAVALCVRKANGALVFTGECDLMSGPELYGPSFDVLAYGETIWVEVSRPMSN